MKKLTADAAPPAGALVLLVSLIGMAFSISAGQVVGPLAGGGMALGILLMGWGAVNGFSTQEDSEMRLSEAVARIRRARHS